jgi:hypothetical protein
LRHAFALLFAVTAAAALPARAGAEPPQAESYLIEGRLAEGETALAEAVKADPAHGRSRFGLGAIQFVRAVERMMQSFHRYGLRTGAFGNQLPFERLPIPHNRVPEAIGYADLRALMQAWVDDLAKAEATLAGVDGDDVKLPLHFGQIRLDFNGDGKADADEVLWKVYGRFNGSARDEAAAASSRDFVITFDRGDVAWLRGYCHLLMAMAELYLAHDGRELFEHTAPLFYQKAKTPFRFLRREPGQPRERFEFGDVADAVAFIHLLRLPVAEPKRMAAVLAHLEQMIALSRESWKFILTETDDDHEWVPGPKQHTVLPGVEVTGEMLRGWTSFLDEADDLLKGKKLAPFWREGDGRGVNLRRVFTEPRTLDAVLWIQGTAAAPYLEEGVKTTSETWSRFQRIFRGEFIGFALWFN